MTDARIDPTTRDYIVTNGAPERDPFGGLANEVYLRLETPLGTYWADPLLGSRLAELKREKDKARVAVLAEQYAESALQPILDGNRASSIVGSTERVKDDTASGRLLLLIEVVDPSGARRTFKHPVKVI